MALCIPVSSMKCKWSSASDPENDEWEPVVWQESGGGTFLRYGGRRGGPPENPQKRRPADPRIFDGAGCDRNLDISAVGWHFEFVVSTKLDHLRSLLRSYGSCLVAYSGGVDSVFLAYMAHEVLKDRALAAIADSPSLPRRELDEALEIARRFEIPVRVLRTREFDNPDYLSNPANRCYFCKSELFSELVPLAKTENFAVIAYGENASDVGDFRPGAKAAAEFQVRAPLKEAGLTKAEIRELSASFGLPTADKPQMACLSSRIPYGEAVSPEKLRMIEEAEYVLRDHGFYDVRVRHHELKTGQLARIEVGPTEIPKLFAGDAYAKIAASIKKAGYSHVTLDLEGYRRGSLNSVLPAAG